MPISAFLNELPKPVWIVATVLAFVFFWPLGLAVLAYLFGSGRIGRRGYAAAGQWYNTQGQPQASCWGKWAPWQSAQQPAAASPSGNAAFDEYRAETLRRLEGEQKEFVDYLERLRRAKDKAEFDQFMADRRRPTIIPEPQPGA